MKPALSHAILLSCLLAAPPAMAAESPAESAKPAWAARLAQVGDKPVTSEYYPTEEALVFLTAYGFTRDARYADAARRQFAYAHAREKDGLFLTSAGTTTRDYQARQTYNFYLAYRVLGDGQYLHWADDCATALLRTIPRKPHTSHGQTHTLFRGDFYTPGGKMVAENPETIDPNQNSEVALAFSLLYHDVGSAWFHDPRAKEIAYEELSAAMSVQDMTTGVLSLTENIPGGDTAYGSYATFSWVWCQLLWKDPAFDQHIRAAARWLGPKTDLAHDSTRFYPTVIEHGTVPDWEAHYRLPLLWYCRVDASQFVDALEARDRQQHVAPLYWAYYDLMGVPREFYLGKGP